MTTRPYFVSFLFSVCIVACASESDPDQKIRVDQLLEFAVSHDLDMNGYDYVLVEGSVKCAGCAKAWRQRLEGNTLLGSSILVICNDNEIPQQFHLTNYNIFETSYDSIEKAFPYSANYFLFFRDKGAFKGFVELGSRNIDIPKSTR